MTDYAPSFWEKYLEFNLLPDELLFHYTTAPGVAGILDSGKFRMSDLRRTNDPRETEEVGWHQTRHDPRYPANVNATISERVEGFDKKLRDNVKLACMTTDDTQAEWGNYWGRGFCRPRNWAQYSDNHRGACLVFDQVAFINSVSDAAANATVRSGAVGYTNRQINAAATDDETVETFTLTRLSWA